jgi:hypothetical protein
MSATLVAFADKIEELGIGTPGQRKYFRYLCWRTNHRDGKCNPRVALTMQDLGRSERHVRHCRRHWEEQGCLRVTHKGRHRASQYTLDVAGIVALIEAHERPICPSQSAEFAPLDPEICPPIRNQEFNQKAEPSESPARASEAAPTPDSNSQPPIFNSADGFEAAAAPEPAAAEAEPPPDWQPEPEIAEALQDRGFAAGELRQEAYDYERGAPCKRLLPEDWQLSARLRTVALSCELNPDDEGRRFRLKARAEGWRFADWGARFELWCLDAVEYRKRNEARRASSDRAGGGFSRNIAARRGSEPPPPQPARASTVPYEPWKPRSSPSTDGPAMRDREIAKLAASEEPARPVRPRFQEPERSVEEQIAAVLGTARSANGEAREPKP